MLTLVGATALGFLIGGGIVYYLVRSFVPGYLAEKGKNLATREDIAAITNAVEEVKTQHAAQLQQLMHENALLLEHIRGQGQLRLAAAERRLQAHQEAFTLWRKIINTVHDEAITDVVLECQTWFNNNALYLSPRAREAFSDAYFAASSHKSLLKGHAPANDVTENWSRIMRLGNEIVQGAELPPLGEHEMKRLSPK
jgi:hypothetical protein